MSKQKARYVLIVMPVVAVVAVVVVLAAAPAPSALAAPAKDELSSPIYSRQYQTQTATAVPLNPGFTTTEVLNSAGGFVTWAGAALVVVIGLIAGRSTVERIIAWMRSAFGG